MLNRQIEQNIFAFIEQEQDNLVRLVHELISIHSINPPGDERKIVLSLDDQRPNLICLINSGKNGKSLILNGHTDTVPITQADAWNTNPFSPQIKSGEMYGLGSTDMKAGLGAMLFAGLALNKFPELWEGSLILTFCADEEYGGRFGTEYLVNETNLKANAAVVCEPSGLEHEFDSLNIACRGISRFKFIVHGKARHSGFSYLPGTINANMDLMWVLQMAKEHLHFEYQPHFLYPQGISINLGLKIEGGVGYALIPDQAIAYNEVRTLPGMKISQIEKGLSEFMAIFLAARPDIKLDVEFEEPPHNWLGGVDITENEPIVKAALVAAESVLPERPSVIGYPATTDARLFIERLGIPTIAAFGPGIITAAHSPNEHVSVESIINAAKIYALMAISFLSNDQPSL
jgi:acetylornithine deacetylase/succinyl-diaminopimelate desuccinylase-like protein